MGNKRETCIHKEYMRDTKVHMGIFKRGERKDQVLIHEAIGT